MRASKASLVANSGYSRSRWQNDAVSVERGPLVYALAVQDLTTGQRVFCAPGLSRIGATEFDWMKSADCLLVDGLDDETPVPGAVPPSVWVDLLAGLPARHKVLLAREGQGDAFSQRGIALAYDGMEIEL